MVRQDEILIGTRKTTQEILQEELLRERLAVLTRAGQNLTDAWDLLGKKERAIEAELACRRAGSAGQRSAAKRAGNNDSEGRLLRLNERIRAYNDQRERVRTCYYYLIVTREALGLIHHQRLEEYYRLPPKRRLLREK
jgi:hypothetical protein